ncbi:interleukin-27 subunit beta isoform X2 [Anolis carolinensis]|uniref:Interleukin-27 subunit beta n=2 Tax=Anolis carolinensis TaxID=28377 RepID=H9GB45_ANOCA|nr:PREDICTED: interleukin-27 subunit beta isoform X2 [Anolis carolinensis]|eukprot:XP_003230614.2 PREDICTED: interleukin-27 subunit beta isoform X2 [Anolis carolinensis]
MGNAFLQMLWTLVLAVLLSTSSGEDATLLKEERGTMDGSVSQHYANLGAPQVILFCPISGNTSAAQWFLNGKAVPEAARKDGSLILRNVTLAQSGEYSCRDSEAGLPLRRIHLKLGYPPEKPDVRCWSASYPAASCNWALPTETHLPTVFFSTYRHGLEGQEYECILSVAEANFCSIPNIQMFTIDPYVLNVTAANPLGSATRLFPIFLEQILKPDPPEAVTVSPIRGEKKKLLLEWKPPLSWRFPEYFPLKYTIRYWREGSHGRKSIRPTEQTSFVLTGIRSGATYYVQVAAKDFLDNGEYSAWSSPASGTAWSDGS